MNELKWWYKNKHKLIKDMETTKQEEQLLSIYEFLGKPAGAEGQKVYEAAKKIWD